MYDFLRVSKRWDNKLQRNVYTPSFVINKPAVKDLLVRGQKFYAIFNPDTGLWETDDSKAVTMIDEQVEKYVRETESAAYLEDPDHAPIIRRISDTSSGLIKVWHAFCEKDYRPEWNEKFKLNQKIMFSNTEPKRSDYATFKLDYPIVEQDTPYYDKLCDRLYLPSEREKWEWYLGCLIAGDQKKIQKMLVFYGEPGTGKSTIIGKVLVYLLTNGEYSYATKFEANGLCGRDAFGTSFLAEDGVFVFDDDAEMNMITVKSTLNKIVSHEPIKVNGKFERQFNTVPNCLLVVGSNEPVQMSPNSGMNRRLIDVRPTGNKLSADEYDECIEHLQFEKSGIAARCLAVYRKHGKNYYDHYIAEDMLNRTSPFQNFVQENYLQLKDGISLAKAYDMYCAYAEASRFKNILVRYKFRDTLKLYFKEYNDTYFSGFKPERIGIKSVETEKKEEKKSDLPDWLQLKEQPSIFDKLYSQYQAQYEQDDPAHPLKYSWAKCLTKLKDLDTKKIHYVKVPLELIVIDLDIRGENDEKCLAKNLEAAKKFPPTYAETSKSGNGIHLHYLYTGGNPEELSRIYGDNVEIKVFNGGSSLRRKLYLCNDLPVASISSGLPLKSEGAKQSDMVDWEGFNNEKQLRSFVINCLQKKHHGHTKPEVDFLVSELDKQYRSGKTYDIRDLKNDIFSFCVNSSNNAQYCMEQFGQMHFYSKDIEDKENEETEEYKTAPIIMLDTEIAPSYEQAIADGYDLPNDIPKDTEALFLIEYKMLGDDATIIKLWNPEPSEVEKLFHYRIVAHKGRDYDGHMLYAASQGYKPYELYELNCKLTSKNNEISRSAKFMQGYKVCYADTLEYPVVKQGLKKWEIQLGIRHLEWPYPWYYPVPKNRWNEFAEYCENDVRSLEAVFNKTHDDFVAKEMLADLAGGTVIDKTNKLATKFVKGDADHLELIYTDFTTGKQYGDGVPFELPILSMEEYEKIGDDWTGVKPVNKNHFPGYHAVWVYEGDKRGWVVHNFFRGIDVGRGGYVYANPGMYGRAVTRDSASHHPSSIEQLNLFGKQTIRYSQLKQARYAIKHHDFDKVKKMFDGKLAKYLNDPSSADALSTALKLVLNAFYGMTSSQHDYFEAKDPRNVNNIVALRGAIVLKIIQDEVEKRGFKVIHIKTDSIKIADPTDEILKLVDDIGKYYGYTFETEHTWEKICLKDDAQFIGRHDADDPLYLSNPAKSEKKFPNRWDATGKYFQIPYVFKSLFTHQPIDFYDMAETINVTAGTLHLVFDPGTDHEVDRFVGRIGQFTPMKPNTGGGVLYRVNDGKRYAASGTKDCEWMETETVKAMHKENDILREYYQKKCDDAIKILKSFGDYEQFVKTD